MSPTSILFPVCALALWTLTVLALIPLARVGAGRRGQVVADDFKYGESPRVPPRVGLPNRNYMNLLELPVLFYVACLLFYVTHGVTATTVAVAWAYVALRIVHSLIHLSYNDVMHRLAAFAASNGVMVVLWVLVVLHLQRIG